MGERVRLRYTITGIFEARWEDYADPSLEGILTPLPEQLAAVVQESILDGTVMEFFKGIGDKPERAAEVLVEPADRPRGSVPGADLDLDAIEARAKDADQGPWVPSPRCPDAVIAPEGEAYEADQRYYGGKFIGESMRRANRDHIAGMNPGTTLALVAKLRASRQFRDDIAAALAPGRWRGFDGPDGVSTHEVIEDIAQALAAYDRHVQHLDDPGKSTTKPETDA